MYYPAFVVSLLFIAYMLTGCGSSYDYVMENGVRCEYRSFRWDSKANTEFYGCEDGKHYLNPATWREVRR